MCCIWEQRFGTDGWLPPSTTTLQPPVRPRQRGERLRLLCAASWPTAAASRDPCYVPSLLSVCMP